MQVQAINTYNNQPNFYAKVAVKTEDIESFMNYLSSRTTAQKPWYNSAHDLGLTNKIFDAFEKHPSKVVIIPDVAYFRNVLFNARGTIESSKAVFIDTEPARSDSDAPIFNIFRRILDPENKKQFNRLVGEEHTPIYESWWKENIAPIWDDINKNFREPTFFEGNYDKEFNADFNRESGKKEDLFIIKKGSFWVKLYKEKILSKQV